MMDFAVTVLILVGAYLVFTMNKHFPLSNILGFVLVMIAMAIELIRERR
jgi:hypothetical protein